MNKPNIKMQEGRLLAAIVESSDDAIISKTLDGIITTWNQAAERMLGYRAEEAIGQSILLIIPPELRNEEADIIANISQGKRVDHIETVRLTKSGKRIPLSITISPIRDEAGNVIGASKTARDISERKRIAEEREMLLRRAEETNRLKDDFLATLSHELRNPLSAVMGWARLIRRGELPPEQMERAWETVDRNLKAENDLISDLLDVSRIVSGRVRLDIRPFHLSDLLEDVIETFQFAADAKGIRLDRMLDPTAGPVAGDPNRIQQVLSNLISNAVKFTNKGGKIQILMQRRDSHAEITISDTGVGISPDFLPHVFERFRQQDSGTHRQHTGLGLGLAIVRHLVELHGGSVRAYSEGPGQGAAFVVKLPILLAVGQGAAGGPSQFQGANKLIAPSVIGLRVLAIDDDADSRDLMMTLLSQVKIEARTADSAAVALKLMEEWSPDVILCDIGMPQQDGFTFIRELRLRPPERGGRTPAAAVTAYARTEDRLRILSAGFQMHLAKPIQPEELFAIIASLATFQITDQCVRERG